MILTLLDLGVNITWWTCKQTYNAIHYMIYGRQLTDRELLMIEIQKLRQEILNKNEL